MGIAYSICLCHTGCKVYHGWKNAASDSVGISFGAKLAIGKSGQDSDETPPPPGSVRDNEPSGSATSTEAALDSFAMAPPGKAAEDNNNESLFTEAKMAATAKPAGGSAISTEAAWDLVAMAARLSPEPSNNINLSTEPEEEMPRKMGPVEAKIAAAMSNRAASDEVADFGHAGIDSAEFDDGIDYNDSTFIDSFEQDTSQNEVIDDGAGFYDDEGLDQPVAKAKKPNNPPKTTSRKKKVERIKIALRKRVKIPRSGLYHILPTDEQRGCIPPGLPNNYNFFGTVVARGAGKSTWNVKFDVLPVHDNVVCNITRTKLTVVGPDEEEQPLSQRDQEKMESLLQVEDEVDEEREKSRKKKAEDDFCSMEADDLKVAKAYTMYYGEKDEECLVWEIVEDGSFLVDHNDPLQYADDACFKAEITEGELEDPAEVFFNYMFPSIKGML